MSELGNLSFSSSSALNFSVGMRPGEIASEAPLQRWLIQFYQVGPSNCLLLAVWYISFRNGVKISCLERKKRFVKGIGGAFIGIARRLRKVMFVSYIKLCL